MLWEANQAQVFLAMVYAGLAMGVCYALLRLLRLLLRAGPVLTALFDLLFWLLAAALAACAAALCGAQSLRLYWLLGALCGAVLWAAGLRRMMRASARLAARILPCSARKEAGKAEPRAE